VLHLLFEHGPHKLLALSSSHVFQLLKLARLVHVLVELFDVLCILSLGKLEPFFKAASSGYHRGLGVLLIGLPEDDWLVLAEIERQLL